MINVIDVDEKDILVMIVMQQNILMENICKNDKKYVNLL
jgi:hypothetical protein